VRLPNNLKCTNLARREAFKKEDLDHPLKGQTKGGLSIIPIIYILFSNKD